MPKQFKSNPNLHLTHSDNFMGLPIYRKGPLVIEYLQATLDTINRALDEHPRTLAIRIDLRKPAHCICRYDSGVITRFFESLNSQIDCDTARKRRKGLRVHPSTVRFVWAKERVSSEYAHYHLLLLFNCDRFGHLGSVKSPALNLAKRIRNAWASALGIDITSLGGGVHFTKLGVCTLRRNSPAFESTFRSLFKRVSYFSKARTKCYGDWKRSFSCSKK